MSKLFVGTYWFVKFRKEQKVAWNIHRTKTNRIGSIKGHPWISLACQECSVYMTVMTGIWYCVRYLICYINNFNRIKEKANSFLTRKSVLPKYIPISTKEKANPLLTIHQDHKKLVWVSMYMYQKAIPCLNSKLTK